MIRATLAAAALALLAPAVAGCGGTEAPARPQQDPGTFMSQLVRDVAAGRYGQVWESLYPPHQRVATRAEYVRCEPLTPFPGEIEHMQVLDVFDEPVAVAGEAREVDSTAITVRMTVRHSLRPAERFEHTFHAVAVEGRWTWFLPESRYAAYRAGSCFTDDGAPVTAPPGSPRA